MKTLLWMVLLNMLGFSAFAYNNPDSTILPEVYQGDGYLTKGICNDCEAAKHGVSADKVSQNAYETKSENIDRSPANGGDGKGQQKAGP